MKHVFENILDTNFRISLLHQLNSLLYSISLYYGNYRLEY